MNGAFFMKLSFDFDGTLARPSVQKFAKQMVEQGHEVYIVTARYEDCDRYSFKTDNNDLFSVAEEVGIKKENIHFMNIENKSEFFKQNPGFLFHLDDDWVELKFINKETKVKGISCFGNSNWVGKALKLLK